MPDIHNSTPEQEIEDLRKEIRSLREQQERQRREIEEAKARESGKGKESEPEDKGKGENEGAGDKDDKKNEEPKKPHPLRTILIIVVVLVALVAAIIWWLHARKYEDTDDAFIDGHTSLVSVRIAGTVTGVYFEENQTVKAGELLADLDPRDYKVALSQARSQLQQAFAQTRAEQPNVPVTRVTNVTNISTANSSLTGAEAAVEAAQRNYEAALSKVTEAEANSAKAQADVLRYRPLAEKDEVPHEQFDQIVATAKALAATVDAARSTAEAARKQVDQSKEGVVQAHARAAEAEENAPRQVAIREANISARQAGAATANAAVEQSLLNLSYCKINAPVSGIIVKRSVEVGAHVSPGQQIFAIAQIDDLWVTANFKETQLRRMREKQSVRIHVDSLDLDFDGYVESLAAASGAVTSLLPPENATGNYVKVVQRLPVRIRFKKDQKGLERLRPGMSVEPNALVE